MKNSFLNINIFKNILRIKVLMLIKNSFLFLIKHSVTYIKRCLTDLKIIRVTKSAFI